MSLIFNGVDQFASADISTSSGNALTVAAFVKPESFSSGTLIAARNSSAGIYAAVNAHNNGTDNVLRGVYYLPGSATSAGVQVAPGAWIPVILHIASSATDTGTLYVGSTTGQTVSVSRNTNNFLNILVGGGFEGFTAGKAAALRAWARDLTAAEIAAFIGATSIDDIDAIDATGRVAAYDLDNELSTAGTNPLTLTGYTATSDAFDSESPFNVLSATVTSSTSATATLPVTGTDGTVFAVAVPPTGSATVPTGPQIEAGTDGADVAATPGSTPVTAAGDISVALTGLTINEEVTIYAVHKALDGTYGEVYSVTATPNPILKGSLETAKDVAYSAQGEVKLTVLNATGDTLVATTTVTPGANGAYSLPIAGLAPATEYLVVPFLADRSLIGGSWLTTGA